MIKNNQGDFSPVEDPEFKLFDPDLTKLVWQEANNFEQRRLSWITYDPNPEKIAKEGLNDGQVYSETLAKVPVYKRPQQADSFQYVNLSGFHSDTIMNLQLTKRLLKKWESAKLVKLIINLYGRKPTCLDFSYLTNLLDGLIFTGRGQLSFTSKPLTITIISKYQIPDGKLSEWKIRRFNSKLLKFEKLKEPLDL